MFSELSCLQLETGCPEPPPHLTETNAFLFLYFSLSLFLYTHWSRGQRLWGKISVIGHRPVVSEFVDKVKLQCVMRHCPASDQSDIINENNITLSCTRTNVKQMK